MTSESAALSSKYKTILSTIIPEDDDDYKISRVSIFIPEDLIKAPMASHYEMVTVAFKEEGLVSIEIFTKKRLPKGDCPVLNGLWTTVMKNEGIFLIQFVNQMKSFCQQHTTDRSDSLIEGLFPRTFYADDEMIAMENLVKKGYSPLVQRDEQDFDLSKLVVKSMARLHAVTNVMIEKEGGKENFLKLHPNFQCALSKPQLMQFFAKAFESALASSMQILKDSKHPEKDETYEILKKWQGNLEKRLIDVITSKSTLSCVCHGNLCGDNIMFNQHGDQLVFVDFQMSRVGSPSLDIGYYLFRSVSQKGRQRWRELLQIYFDMLTLHQNSLGQAVNFTFEEFVGDFVKKAEMGFLFGIFFANGSGTNCHASTEKISQRIVDLVKDYQALQSSQLNI